MKKLAAVLTAAALALTLGAPVSAARTWHCTGTLTVNDPADGVFEVDTSTFNSGGNVSGTYDIDGDGVFVIVVVCH